MPQSSSSCCPLQSSGWCIWLPVTAVLKFVLYLVIELPRFVFSASRESNRRFSSSFPQRSSMQDSLKEVQLLTQADSCSRASLFAQIQYASLNFVGKSVILHRMAFRSSFMLAFLLLFGLQVWGAHEDDLPGWMGENHVSRDSEGEVIQHVDRRDPTRVIQLSWKPRAFLHKNFLTDAECEHMIELAKDKLEKSMVADNESGKSVASDIRTSSGMFLMKGQDDIISRIEDKIATWTFLPKENGEAIQVLRYQDGEKYEPHFDYFHDKNNQALGGHRIATVLMYLSDVVKGGETVFPSSEDRGGPKDDTWSPCGKTGVAVKPRKGDALLFFSLHPSAVPDESSLHTGCPVLEGEKWSATKWIHVLPFEKPRPKNGACTNEDEKCDEWAAYGECQKNPAYMVGTKEWPGACRKACKLC